MTDVVTRTTLRGVPKPKPSTKRSFRIPDDVYTEGQAAADFLDVYLSEAVRAGIEDLIAQAKTNPEFESYLAEWLAARKQEK